MCQCTVYCMNAGNVHLCLSLTYTDVILYHVSMRGTNKCLDSHRLQSGCFWPALRSENVSCFMPVRCLQYAAVNGSNNILLSRLLA